jgi:hypothetical protein
MKRINGVILYQVGVISNTLKLPFLTWSMLIPERLRRFRNRDMLKVMLFLLFCFIYLLS